MIRGRRVNDHIKPKQPGSHGPSKPISAGGDPTTCAAALPEIVQLCINQTATYQCADKVRFAEASQRHQSFGCPVLVPEEKTEPATQEASAQMWCAVRKKPERREEDREEKKDSARMLLSCLCTYHSYRSSAPDGKHTVPSLAPSSSLLHWSPAPNPSLLQSLSVPSPKSCAPRMLCPSPPTKPSLPAALLTRPLALGALIAPCLLVLPLDLRSSWPTPGGQLLQLKTCAAAGERPVGTSSSPLVLPLRAACAHTPHPAEVQV
eukprot:1160602-Pelagomonas_calceolata.AAC.12